MTKKWLIILGGWLLAPGGFAGEIEERRWTAPSLLDSAGLRAGLGTNRGTKLSSFEFFATSRPVKTWRFSGSVTGSLRLEGALGMLNEDGDVAFLARMGPLLEVTFGDSPIHLMAGTSATYLSEHRFGKLDLGSEFQFVSLIGFDWDFAENWVLGYRWQHISNAGFSEINPGLNLNTISIGFRF